MFDKAIAQYLKEHDFSTFQPKVVLFDMDGVLYNSMPNHVVAWDKSMKQFGLEMTADEVYAYEGMRGMDIERMIAKKLTGKEITDDEARHRYEVKSDIFEQLPRAEIFAGVKEFMAKLNRMGIMVGIVTGSGQRPLIERLKRDFADFITEERIVTAFDVKRGKPYPDPYLQGLKKAGNLQPWQGIVVENAPMGVHAGAAAGIFTIGVNSGPLPDSALSSEGANLVFSRMTDLLDAFPQSF
jgi:beta-phosphoglucomutase